MLSQYLLLFTAFIACISAIDWTPLNSKVNELIQDAYFSGCVLGVYTNNATLYQKAYGTITPKWASYSAPITLDMKFDLNYLTQVIGINAALMLAIDNYQITL